MHTNYCIRIENTRDVFLFQIANHLISLFESTFQIVTKLFGTDS